jgi:P-type Ca2+ transporter type 2C
MNLNRSPYQLEISDLLKQLNTDPKGLSQEEAVQRQAHYGPNTLPTGKKTTMWQIIFKQFMNPLIYILVAASAISISLGDYSDSIFIWVVILVNGLIGTIQEYSAEKSTQSLLQMTPSTSHVLRDGRNKEVDSAQLVPGDVVMLESGQKVPADMRLISDHGLEIDESLLTGESVPLTKQSSATFTEELSVGDQLNMAFTGSIVTKGRGRGVVTGTGMNTELGKIADSLSVGSGSKPPLLIRMEAFTKKIALTLLVVTAFMALFLFLKGESLHEVMMFSVAIAVSAIPEGLPVSLTIALAVASLKMSRRNVIVRELPAVEALGSCSFIATDKTGTLTVNQLTIKKVSLPQTEVVSIEGSGLAPEGGEWLAQDKQERTAHLPLIQCGVLCNESQLRQDDGQWQGIGDAVDLAFLVLAHKANVPPDQFKDQWSLYDETPFEPENQFAATWHKQGEKQLISVKGATEKLLPMCTQMQTPSGLHAIDPQAISRQMDLLAQDGFRVLALAGTDSPDANHQDLKNQMRDLTFYGLVGMIDPLRPEAKEAIESCRQAGVDIAMVTGDHPITALAIAKELNLAQQEEQVVSGPQLKEATEVTDKHRLMEKARVFARVEPQQKLEIVQYLIQSGRFVAVTGDGANDAPALKEANVGVAMGQSGTDIAKETSNLIITDDRFASIVAGIEEGRIAYSNIRKVIYLLLSTGAAEVFLFLLSLVFGTPLPLTAVQVLWLNLVTNGIQDKGLAFEPGEGDELSQPPRKPNEPIFDRLMLERIALSALVMGGVSFAYFNQLINSGIEVGEARNLTLLLLVLFENVMIGNCRSETKSAFKISLTSNKILLLGTLGAQLIHIAAMFTPGLSEVLGVSPVSFYHWSQLLVLAMSVLLVMELYKLLRPRLGHGLNK